MGMPRFKHSSRIGAASVIGPLHAKKEIPNQDSYAYFYSEQLIAIAVADGLGSASHSEEGSSFATHITVGHLMSYLYNYGRSNAPIPDTSVLKRRIVSRWQKRFRPMSDYDTTLLFVGISPKVCVMGQIGDGLILHKHSNESAKFEVFLKPEKEYLNQPESSLAQTNAVEFFHLQERQLSSDDYYTAVLLMTDGIADDLSDPARYSNDLVQKLSGSSLHEWNAILNKHLTDWPTPGHYDDKTLVVLSSEPKESKEPTKELENTGSVETVETETFSDQSASKSA